MKNKCAVCGSEHQRGKKFAINHKDRDFSNNEDYNLEVLCAKCHGRQHQMEMKIAFDLLLKLTDITTMNRTQLILVATLLYIN